MVSEAVEVEEVIEEEREVRMTTVFGKSVGLARIEEIEDGSAGTMRRMELSLLSENWVEWRCVGLCGEGARSRWW